MYVWGVTRARHGRVLLRIEDHDRVRSRPEFEAAILEDLAWLGFVADEPMVRQSERGAIYETAIESLRQRGLVYACACSRNDIASANASPASELRYPGTCASKGLAERAGLGLRIRLAPSVERFDDLLLGPQEQRPSEQCGDLLARDRDGHWTYQFAAAADDFAQGVTLVIRGDDLLASTGRQLQLARLLGRTQSLTFLHHSLVMKTSTRKLSKSDGDTGVHELRAKGWTPHQVIHEARRMVGLREDFSDLA
jgi:glutamyl/glutaminyl-tRNA synthetase